MEDEFTYWGGVRDGGGGRFIVLNQGELATCTCAKTVEYLPPDSPYFAYRIALKNKHALVFDIIFSYCNIEMPPVIEMITTAMLLS